MLIMARGNCEPDGNKHSIARLILPNSRAKMMHTFSSSQFGPSKCHSVRDQVQFKLSKTFTHVLPSTNGNIWLWPRQGPPPDQQRTQSNRINVLRRLACLDAN